MHRRAKTALDLSDELSLQYLVAGFYDRLGGYAYMLGHGNMHFFRRRHFFDRTATGGFMLVYMYAAVEGM